MSSYDYDLVIEKMPAAIEAIQEEHLRKIPASVESVYELAKASGAPQFETDAKEWERVVGINTDYIKRICGEEGDKGTETSSLWGHVTTAKKMKIAVGGEL